MLIAKSAFVEQAPRLDSITGTEPSICRIVFEDGEVSLWFLTKVKGIKLIDTALETGAITPEEGLVLKQQVHDNLHLFACHPNLDEAADLIQEANDGDSEVLFAIFMAREYSDQLDDDSSELVLPR